MKRVPYIVLALASLVLVLSAVGLAERTHIFYLPVVFGPLQGVPALTLTPSIVASATPSSFPRLVSPTPSRTPAPGPSLSPCGVVTFLPNGDAIGNPCLQPPWYFVRTDSPIYGKNYGAQNWFETPEPP